MKTCVLLLCLLPRLALAQTCGVAIGIVSAPASVTIGSRGTVTFTLDGPRPITRVQVLLDGTLAGEVDGQELRDMTGLRFSVPRTPKPYNLTLATQDAQGCTTTSTGAHPVQVVDALGPPPTLSCPTRATVNAASLTAMGLYTPTTTGGVAPVRVTCTPASGSTFTGGPTNVSCTATDVVGRSAGCVFPLTVQVVSPLATPLVLTCPSGISVVAPGQPQFAIPVPAGGGSYLAFCDHNPTDAFPLGVTTVSCQAQDFVGTQGSCSFTVTVTAAQ